MGKNPLLNLVLDLMDKYRFDKPIYYSLTSGSDGSSFLLCFHNRIILIDAGISCIQLRKKLESLGLSILEITDVLVTHEHKDHVRSLRLIVDFSSSNVYINRKVYEAVRDKYDQIGILAKYTYIKEDVPFYLDDIKVTPFKTSHDSVKCFGFVFDLAGEKLMHLTDTGVLTPDIIKYSKNIKYAVIEANYDVSMFKEGKNYLDIKKRYDKYKGHLSNDQTGECCQMFAFGGLQKVMLVHLSRVNNTPELAKATVEKYLKDFPNITITVAKEKEIVRFL